MINSMGDKITAKGNHDQGRRAGGSGRTGLLQSIDEAKSLARDMGYPVILKATAGGGGKGMRIVWNDDEMERAYNTARAEAGGFIQK